MFEHSSFTIHHLQNPVQKFSDKEKMMDKLELSPELEKFRDKIESSLKPFIAIRAEKNNNLALWQSKFGGLPYLPKGSEYPKGTQNTPLFLLAQINFEEFPYLEGFPPCGILQFYIGGGDDFYGANWDNPTEQDDFRVVYFPDVSKIESDLVTDFSFLPEQTELPLFESCSLQFEKKIAPVGVMDYEFEKIFDQRFFEAFGDKEEDVLEEYEKKFPSDGHKIGGYAFFTQEDPRADGKEAAVGKDILLLQIDTDADADIMWGDSGVGNFFISQADLEKRDFSQVLYTWDCC